MQRQNIALRDAVVETTEEHLTLNRDNGTPGPVKVDFIDLTNDDKKDESKPNATTTKTVLKFIVGSIQGNDLG
jgi:hypothetical protein